MGRDGTRVIDLRFSGRNLTAPPQGYTARSEANVKRWIAALPAPANAPPDDTLTILDEPDANAEDELFYDVRCSGDTFLLNNRGGGDILDIHCSAGATCEAGVSHGKGVFVEEEPRDSGDSPVASASSAYAPSVCQDTAQLQSYDGSQVGMRTMSNQNAVATVSQKSEKNNNKGLNRDVSICALVESETPPQHVAYQNDVLQPTVEGAALEVGMERYLGMAEVKHGSSNTQSLFRYALQLAVEDRIRCRMRHIQHRVEWQKKDTQLCKQIQLLEIASARNTLLESQIQDLQAEIHRNKTSALEEASHAREQLDQAQAIMNDHISDLSSRVSILAHDLRNSESTISKLRSADRSLSLQLLKAENCNKQLQQELLDAQSTVETLTMELNDNVQRWEHECTSRMEAEEALKQALADLVEAKSAAKAAAECAHKSDREKAAAVQHLSSLRTRKGNLHSVKMALVADAESMCCKLPNSGEVAKAICSANLTLPPTPVRTRCTVASLSITGSRQHDLGKASKACQMIQNRAADRSLNISHRMSTAGTSSDLQHTAPQPEVHPETDRDLIHLEAELVDVAMQRAPQHLKALGFAFRCLIICPTVSCQGIAHAVAVGIQHIYHTMVCVLKTLEHKHSSLLDPAERLAYTTAETDVHAVKALLPVCHTVVFVTEAMETSGTPNRCLVRTASWNGCQILFVQHVCTHPGGTSVSHHSNQTAPDLNPIMTISAETTNSDCVVVSQGQQDQMQRAIGVPDSALRFFSTESLKSIQKHRAPRSTACSNTARQPLDLATFNMPHVSCISLISQDVETESEVALSCTGATLSEAARTALSSSRSPPSVASSLELASMLLRTNKFLQILDLSCVPVGIHGARRLAELILGGCYIRRLVFKTVALQVADILGRNLPGQKQSKEHALDLPGPKLDQEDMAFMTVLLTSGVAPNAIAAVMIRGHVAVPDCILEDFASAVAGVDHIHSVQAIPRQQMEAGDGHLCLHPASSYLSSHTTTAGANNCHVGKFGVLVAAKMLARLVCKSHTDMIRHSAMDANTLDGLPEEGCVQVLPLSTVELTGSNGGSYANSQMAMAVAARGASPQLTMNLARTMPEVEGCQAWACAAKKALGRSLTCIDLSRNNLNDDSMESLAPMFGACTNLRVLDLSYNAIGRKGMMILCKHISFATPLCSLSVVGNRVPDGAVVPLAGLMLPCAACKLEFLDISQNFSLGTTAAIKLAQALENNTDLQDLRLANCQLGAAAVEAIVKSLYSNTSLSQLDISGCKLGQGGVAKLSTALEVNSAITILSLAKNSLGDRGAASIATILQRNHLIRLDTSYNQIQMTGAEILAGSLQKCTVLCHLDLSGNDLGDHGIAAIIQRAQNLSSIVLSKTGMTAKGLIHVANWMLSNASKIRLQHLDVSKNLLGDNGTRNICTAINSCTQLKTVKLTACRLGCSSGRNVLSMLECLSDSEAVNERRHSLQEICLNQNPRLDAVTLSSVQELLAHRQAPASLQHVRRKFRTVQDRTA